MLKPKYIILVTSLVLVVFGGVYFFWSQNQNMPKENLDLTKKTEIEVDQKSSFSMNDSDDQSITSNTNSSKFSSQTSLGPKPKVLVESGYADYDSAKLTNAEYIKVVLFFHAKWCPSCKGLDEDIKKNLTNIPNDLLILKVDYDSNQTLKNKYKVTTQHTLVQVDQNGDLIKLSPGLYQLNTLDSIIQTF